MIIKYVGVLILTVGAILLGVATLGHLTYLGNYKNVPPRPGEAFDQGLVAATMSWAELADEANLRVAHAAKSGGGTTMMVLYKLVSERFTHGDLARHNVFSNWLLAGLGGIHPAFSHIRVPRNMVQRGHSLLCDQSSYLLLMLAQAYDIHARHVGLGGHVVMEAWYDDDWHLFDPDLEIVPIDDDGRVLSAEELARNIELLKRYYGKYDGTNASMVEILGSREDNTFVSYPPGAWFEWKSNILFWFEKFAEILKYAFPALMMGIGVLLVSVGRQPAISEERD